VHLSCKNAPGFEVPLGFTSPASQSSPACLSGIFEWGQVLSPPRGYFREGKSVRAVTGVNRGSGGVCVMCGQILGARVTWGSS
jgi:hypothetical protein